MHPGRHRTGGGFGDRSVILTFSAIVAGGIEVGSAVFVQTLLSIPTPLNKDNATGNHYCHYGRARNEGLLPHQK